MVSAFGFSENKKKPDVTRAVDTIEAVVYAALKPHGFCQDGRTLHRFVSGDISQVIHFETGKQMQNRGGLLRVNTGIRVPECAERDFFYVRNAKTVYRISECNIRSELGAVYGGREAWFDLTSDPSRLAEKIRKIIERRVLPAFDVLNSRESILARRRDLPRLDALTCRTLLLDEAMLYGTAGDLKTAKKKFDAYYQTEVAAYTEQETKGTRLYLKKGERRSFHGQTITAEKSGYITVYGGDREHMDALDALAARVRIWISEGAADASNGKTKKDGCAETGEKPLNG